MPKLEITITREHPDFFIDDTVVYNGEIYEVVSLYYEIPSDTGLYSDVSPISRSTLHVPWRYTLRHMTTGGRIKNVTAQNLAKLTISKA